MLAIQEFLRKHSRPSGTDQMCPEIAYSLLDELYKVSVKRHGEYPNLVLLKYNQIESPMAVPVVQECRGIILDEADNFEVVSMGYTKFFNHGEGHAAPIDWSSARVWEKIDGSLITLYWYNGWHVATSGTPDAQCDINGEALTFSELFWETLTAMEVDVEVFDHDYCYMFELCAPENRVVVPHNERKLHLHGVRHILTLREVVPDFWAKVSGVPLPRSWPLTSIDEVVQAAADLKPLEQEGYVVCDGAFNRVKVKSPAYVAIHHAKDTLSERNIANLIRMGESSEFLTYFPQLMEIHSEMEDRYLQLVDGIGHAWAAHSHIQDQKEFALQVKDLSFSGALFALKSGRAKTAAEYIKGLTEPAYHRLMGLKKQTTRTPEE